MTKTCSLQKYKMCDKVHWWCILTHIIVVINVTLCNNFLFGRRDSSVTQMNHWLFRSNPWTSNEFQCPNRTSHFLFMPLVGCKQYALLIWIRVCAGVKKNVFGELCSRKFKHDHDPLKALSATFIFPTLTMLTCI